MPSCRARAVLKVSNTLEFETRGRVRGAQLLEVISNDHSR